MLYLYEVTAFLAVNINKAGLSSCLLSFLATEILHKTKHIFDVVIYSVYLFPYWNCCINVMLVLTYYSFQRFKMVTRRWENIKFNHACSLFLPLPICPSVRLTVCLFDSRTLSWLFFLDASPQHYKRVCLLLGRWENFLARFVFFLKICFSLISK